MHACAIFGHTCASNLILHEFSTLLGVKRHKYYPCFSRSYVYGVTYRSTSLSGIYNLAPFGQRHAELNQGYSSPLPPGMNLGDPFRQTKKDGFKMVMIVHNV